MADQEHLSIKFQGGHADTALCIDCKPDGSRIISGGGDGEVCLWGRSGNLEHKIHTSADDCTSVWISKCTDNIFYVSSGTAVKVYDERNLQQSLENYQFNEDEINQIVLDEKENFLAACDDSGEIKVISLQEKRLYKTLRKKHTNICSTVCFRQKRPWEIFTGGMDCNLIHWDYSRPKCLNQFNMQEVQDASSELGAYMVNPPFVHHLSASPDGRFLACGLENGFVSVFDTTKKHISEVFTLRAHTQGVSQVHFISDQKLITGGNDCVIVEWDLNKVNENMAPSEMEATNGHTALVDDRNAQITENCRSRTIQHTSKLNWLKYFRNGENSFVLIADQSAELTLMPMQI